MDYPLAKALQEASFVREGRGTRVVRPDAIDARRDDFAYVPSLEQLIEELPYDGYFRITRCVGNCVAECGRYETYQNAPGDTPLEADARLWLRSQ